MTPPETKVLTMTGRDLIARFCTLNLDRTGDEAIVMLRDEIVAALRQTRGEPELDELAEMWKPLSQGGIYRYGQFAREVLAKWGGSGLGEAEVRERERKAFEIGAWYGYNVPLQSDFAQTAEREALHRYPAPPAAPKSVTCERCGGEIDFSETPSGPVSHYNRDDCIRALAAQVRQEGR